MARATVAGATSNISGNTETLLSASQAGTAVGGLVHASLRERRFRVPT